MDSNDETELVEYREKVVAELERRTIRLREIEAQVAHTQASIESVGGGRKIMAGGTARIQVEAAHKAKLKEVLRGLYRERELAVSDLHKAEVRLQEVDARLEELHVE